MSAGYPHHIFVSYAHIDDRSIVPDTPGWISVFHKALSVRLSQLLGKNAEVWRDPKLSGNDFFGEQLIQRLEESAALVSIITPRYLNSEWCQREVSEFCRIAGPHLKVGNKARVFKVLKTPVDRGSEPEPLDALLGYEFFETDKDSGRTREFSMAEETEKKLRTGYYQRLEDLAQDVAELLRKLEDGAPELAAGGPEPSSVTKVYLASTSLDRRKEHDSIRRELLGSGRKVVPEQSVPLYSPACEDFIREEFNDAVLSVHLIGDKYGIVPEGTDSSIIALEAEQTLSRSDVRSLFWMAPGTEERAEDERQAKLIARLQGAGAAANQQELLVCPIEQLKLHIHKRLGEIERAAQAAEKAQDEGSDEDAQIIYLVCDQRDLDAVDPVYNDLFESGFEVRLPAFEGDEAQVRADHEEALVECDAVLIYWGAANDLWLRRKMRDLKKVMGLGRSSPFAAKGVYIKMSDSPAKRRFRTREAQVYKEDGEFDPELLVDFVHAARGEG